MQYAYTKGLLILFIILLTGYQVNAEKHHRVEVDLDGRKVQELATLGVAMDLVDYKPGVSVVGEFSESELKDISEAGFSYDILINDMTSYYRERNKAFDREELNRQMRETDNGTPYPTPENFSLGSMGGFHTNDEALDELDEMHALYPDLISEKQPIGETTTIEGRDVYWVRISNDPEVEQDKPKVLYTALTHAREPASMQQMLFQMWYLLENYDQDPEIQYLVDQTEMYFVPVVNPDGYVYCETTHPNGGSMHRKNKRQNSDGSIGVDINRNFGYEWGYDNIGSSPNPSAATYRGTAPFSEPVTQLQKKLAETFDFSLALNNHTYSDLLIYPWGYNGQQTEDNDIFMEYADMMTRENGYVYGTCYETLGYYANGGSDDWFYGEQDTTEKVFAFTPEAGKQSDGFWPAMNRIEEICAGHTHMNLSLARLALSYAELTDLTGQYISERSTDIEFELLNLGQNSPADFTVALTPLTESIVDHGDPVDFTDMNVLERDTAAIAIELDPYLNTGDEISFVLGIDNGDYTWNDTITKYYGEPEVVFFDPCDNLDHWTTDSWGNCNDVYYSAPASIADSPGQNYENNAHTTLTIKDPFDFSETFLAWVEFQTRYDIEANWDYVQFLYSTDNKQTWIPLGGELTSEGGSNQDPGEPLYHGTQNQWAAEQVDLSHLTGESEVWLKFRLVSDHMINKEGFYIDDFKLITLDYDESYHFHPPENISFYQHQDTVIDFSEHVSWELEGDIQVTWDETEHIDVGQTEETTVTLQNADETWTGEETILFSISDDLAEREEEITISVEAVPAPVIAGQEETEMLQGTTLDFEPYFLTISDDFFSYPEAFTINLQDGENHTVSDELTIVPDPGFSGDLTVPVTVNNGFYDSEVFDFLLEVQSTTGLPAYTDETLRIYYDNRTGEIVVHLPGSDSNEEILLRISDIKGRTVFEKEYKAAERIREHVPGLKGGMYIVTVQGDGNVSGKIILQ